MSDTYTEPATEPVDSPEQPEGFTDENAASAPVEPEAEAAVAADPSTDDATVEGDGGEPEPQPAAEPASTPEPATAEPKARRPKGNLEASVKLVCDDFAAGNLTLEDGELLTPHKVSRLIAAREGIDAPSTGAVAACFGRWAEYGYANFNAKPLAFTGYTEAAYDKGLTALKAAYSERNRAAKKAEKDAAAAAPAAAPEVVAEPAAPEPEVAGTVEPTAIVEVAPPEGEPGDAVQVPVPGVETNVGPTEATAGDEPPVTFVEDSDGFASPVPAPGVTEAGAFGQNPEYVAKVD